METTTDTGSTMTLLLRASLQLQNTIFSKQSQQSAIHFISDEQDPRYHAQKKIASKVLPLTLEANVGGMLVEVKPSSQ